MLHHTMYALDRQAAPATQHVAADPPAEPVGIQKNTHTYTDTSTYPAQPSQAEQNRGAVLVGAVRRGDVR